MKKQHEFKGVLLILSIIGIIILLGITAGFLYSLLPEHRPQESKRGCESLGGEWLEDQGTCLISNKETGESCTDGGQCRSGICFPSTLTEEQTIALADGPVQNIVGTCYPEDQTTGCVAQVRMGTVTKESLCLENE